MKRKKIKPVCPKCGKIGSGAYWKTFHRIRWRTFKDGKARKAFPGYRYLYFAHKIKKTITGWSIKWCYLGKRERIERSDLGNK